MYNYFMFIGKLLEINEFSFTLELKKDFKNEEGVFDTYTVKVYVSSSSSFNLSQLIIGKILSVKGTLKPCLINEDFCMPFAESVTLMSSYKEVL